MRGVATETLADHAVPTNLIYLSPVPWASFAQRPQHFVRWWREATGAEVLWLDPYPTRLVRLADLTVAAPKMDASAEAPPSWLEIERPRALPIEPLPGGTVLNALRWRAHLAKIRRFAARAASNLIVVGKPSQFALRVLSSLPGTSCVYDAMDDFPAFYKGLSRRAMARTEAALLVRATRVLASSTASVRRLSQLRPDVVPVLNACDAAALPPVLPLRTNCAPLVIGYVGTIGHWFDWRFVVSLARSAPTASVRLIGPVFTPGPANLPPNVELRPACSHAEAIAAMREFSVALIPFLRNPLTESVDPVKYYEYRAIGLPVISTAFGEMRERANTPGVFLASAEQDLSRVLERALAYRDDADGVVCFRAENDWRKRFLKGLTGLSCALAG